MRNKTGALCLGKILHAINYPIVSMAEVLLPCFIAEEPLLTFFDNKIEDTVKEMCTLPKIATLPTDRGYAVRKEPSSYFEYNSTEIIDKSI